MTNLSKRRNLVLLGTILTAVGLIAAHPAFQKQQAAGNEAKKKQSVKKEDAKKKVTSEKKIRTQDLINQLRIQGTQIPQVKSIQKRELSYKQLFEKAEIVVIAKVESIETPKNPADDMQPFKLITYNATLNIELTLKGRIKKQEINFIYSATPKLKPDSPYFFHRYPQYITLRSVGKPLSTELKILDGEDKSVITYSEKPSYLFFLSKRKDNRYEPATSDTTPSLSVSSLK